MTVRHVQGIPLASVQLCAHIHGRRRCWHHAPNRCDRAWPAVCRRGTSRCIDREMKECTVSRSKFFDPDHGSHASFSLRDPLQIGATHVHVQIHGRIEVGPACRLVSVLESHFFRSGKARGRGCKGLLLLVCVHLLDSSAQVVLEALELCSRHGFLGVNFGVHEENLPLCVQSLWFHVVDIQEGCA